MTSRRRNKRSDIINPRDYSRRAGEIGGCGCGSQSQIMMRDAERKQEGRGERNEFINIHRTIFLDI